MDEIASKWDALLARLRTTLDGKASVVETHRQTDSAKTVFAEAEFRSPDGNGPQLQLVCLDEHELQLYLRDFTNRWELDWDEDSVAFIESVAVAVLAGRWTQYSATAGLIPLRDGSAARKLGRTAVGPAPERATNTLSLVEQAISTTEKVRHWLFFIRQDATVHTRLDFVVDGIPLRDLVSAWEGLPAPLAQVSRLNDADPYEAIDEIDMLLGCIFLPDGDRMRLMYDQVSNAMDDGGLTMDLSLSGDAVSWSGFGWGVPAKNDEDTDYEEDTTYIEGAPSYTFDRAQYEAVLLEARDRYVRLIR